MKGKIITIIGAIIALLTAITPWIIVRGGETLQGFYFGWLYIIPAILAVIVIILSLIKKRISWAISSIIGIFFVIWSLYIFSAVRAFSAEYIGITYDAEWLGAGAASFADIGYGIYLIIFAGILILAGSILRLKNK